MYSLAHFGAMLQDEFRTRAYVDALKRLIKPDSVVLDIGAGSGYFSLLAIELGARKVYAIEPSASVRILTECAKHLGVQDRVQVFQEISQKIKLPERVDLIVSDLRGGTPFLGEHIPTLIDARQRFLKPGGVLLPQKDYLYAAPVCLERFAALTHPADTTLHPVDMTPKHNKLINQLHPLIVQPKELLAPGRCWAELEYLAVENTDATGELDWVMEKSSEMNGLVWWFESELFEDIRFSAQPGNETAYRNWFFPLPEVVTLQTGDRIKAKLSAIYTRDDYKFAWNTKIYSVNDTEPARTFKQSTFKGEIIDPKMLKTSIPGVKPEITREGQAALFALQMMSGDKTIDEIAGGLCSEFADVFVDNKSARAVVQKLGMRYAKL